MTTVPVTANPYGYQGHLSEAVFGVLENNWRLSNGIDAMPMKLSHRQFYWMLDKISEQKTHLAQQVIMKDAGYLLSDGTIFGQGLWDDLVLAGLSFPVGNQTMLASPKEWWLDDEKTRKSYFDSNGYFIPGSVTLDRKGDAIDVARLMEISIIERGNPRTTDEALVDESIEPRLPMVAKLDEPRMVIPPSSAPKP